MIEVRQARPEDADAILSLVHEFHAEGLDEFNLFCDDDKAMNVIKANMKHGLVLTKDGEIIGCLGGELTSGIVTTDLVYQEQIWFVSKNHRQHGIRLIRELERKCSEWGVDKIVMVHLGSLNADKMKVFYERLNYRFLEAHYIKEIS